MKSRTPGDSDLIGLRFFFFFESSLGVFSVQLKLKTTRLDFLSPLFFFFAVDLALIFCLKWEKGKLRLLTQGSGKPVGKYTAVEYGEPSVCLGVRKHNSRRKPPLGQAPHWLSCSAVPQEHSYCPERASKRQLLCSCFSKAMFLK